MSSTVHVLFLLHYVYIHTTLHIHYTVHTFPTFLICFYKFGFASL